jgi:hypothetical protein
VANSTSNELFEARKVCGLVTFAVMVMHFALLIALVRAVKRNSTWVNSNHCSRSLFSDLILFFPVYHTLTASGVPRHDPSSQRILHGQLPQHLPRRRPTCECVIDQQVLCSMHSLRNNHLQGVSVLPSMLVIQY